MARRGENIHKRKDGRWEGRYIKARTPDRRICWGYIYGTTYAEVKQRLIHKKSEYGGFQLIDAHLTFTELAEAWLWSVKCGLKESTYAHYQYTLYKYVLPILGTVPILRLEENILDQALQKIIAPPDGQHKELGFSSARECLSMVRRICKYAVHLRLIRPMELSVRLPQEKSHSMTPLSVVEQNRLRTYVLSNPTPRKLGLLLGIESGLRIGEVCGLKWDDFDLKTGTVQIKRAVSRIPCGDGHTKIVIQTPKTRTSRREIPLSKHMVQALKILQKSYPSDAWFLSGNTIKPVEPRCYRKSIKTYLKQAAVHQVRPHVLRHTFATTCLQSGCDIKTLSELLGHANPDKFKIRKFGVSDVIAITAAGKTAFYYVDKEALVKFNGFLAPKAEGSYLILNEDGYQIEGQTDTWKVIDEKNVQEQRFVQLVCEQTKKQKPDIVLHDSGVLVAQTIYGFDSSVMKKIEKFLREQKPELLHHQKFLENGTAERAKESGTEQNYNMIDGCVNNNPKKPRIIGNRISVLDRLHIKLEERKQKSQPQQQQQQERSRKN